MAGNKKGHPNYYKGKKDAIDLLEFGNANIEFTHGVIDQYELCKRIGVSYPTLRKFYTYWVEQVEKKIAEGAFKMEEPNGKKESTERAFTDNQRV